MSPSEAALVARVGEALKPSAALLLAEHEQALAFLAGLHPCLTIDGPPMAVAERIFDAVMAERSGLLEKIENGERNLEWMRQHLQKTKA